MNPGSLGQRRTSKWTQELHPERKAGSVAPLPAPSPSLRLRVAEQKQGQPCTQLVHVAWSPSDVIASLCLGMFSEKRSQLSRLRKQHLGVDVDAGAISPSQRPCNNRPLMVPLLRLRLA